MNKNYDHTKVEEKWYRFWEERGYFTPQIDTEKKPFVITLPPPNVTGGLHVGHAMYTVEDVLARFYRMKGRPTLFLPGFDHASIAVEYLVGKKIREEGKTKKELGRAEFLRRAEKFAEESRRYIRRQLKKLGYSLDWSHEAYTMDEVRSRAVEEAFNRLHKKGLIYQGDYLVNWCPGCQTVISDLENVYEEVEGKLYFVNYGPLTVATTRPETMFADVAVAVNPDDERYKSFVGQKVPLPLTDRKITVISDDAVDPEFGTGALKITPAHDQLDFEIGRRHGLPMDKTAIGVDGKLTELTGEFAGLSVEEGRKKVIEQLKREGFLDKVEEHVHSVGHCERCGSVTECLVSTQWFIKMEPLAKKAIAAVEDGQIKIIPKRFEKVYFHWLKNIKDWCISRQLWWGHKIPLEGVEDTLDTWFSSSLWPISTLGWPSYAEASEGLRPTDFEYFYPTTVRETGYDILFFWVAREIMICLELTGKAPFETVYLHGLVRDEQGRKFSKTKGIGFDPLEVVEKYGADALRMALLVGNPPGNDVSVGREKIKGMRNFANKLWNIARFLLLDKGKNNLEEPSEKDKALKVLVTKTVEEATKEIEKYRIDLAAERLYHVIWDDLASEYLEAYKKGLVSYAVLLNSFLTLLKLLHPFMPFVTEELYQRLPNKDAESIMIALWPGTEGGQQRYSHH